MKKNVTLTMLKMMTVAALLLPLPSLAFAQAPDSPAITKAFADLKAHSLLAEDDAVTLESYTRSGVSWQSHAARLTTIKDHANNLISDFKTVDSMREEGSEWQRETIDRIKPLLNDMASHMNATLNHLNDNPGGIKMPAYKDYVRANREFISKAHRTICDAVDYGEARAKADSLEQGLGLPTEAAIKK